MAVYFPRGFRCETLIVDLTIRISGSSSLNDYIMLFSIFFWKNSLRNGIGFIVTRI